MKLRSTESGSCHSQAHCVFRMMYHHMSSNIIIHNHTSWDIIIYHIQWNIANVIKYHQLSLPIPIVIVILIILVFFLRGVFQHTYKSLQQPWHQWENQPFRKLTYPKLGKGKSSSTITPWKINMEHTKYTNHPWKERNNDLPNPYDYVPAVNLQGCTLSDCKLIPLSNYLQH